MANSRGAPAGAGTVSSPAASPSSLPRTGDESVPAPFINLCKGESQRAKGQNRALRCFRWNGAGPERFGGGGQEPTSGEFCSLVPGIRPDRCSKGYNWDSHSPETGTFSLLRTAGQPPLRYQPSTLPPPYPPASKHGGMEGLWWRKGAEMEGHRILNTKKSIGDKVRELRAALDQGGWLGGGGVDCRTIQASGRVT